MINREISFAPYDNTCVRREGRARFFTVDEFAAKFSPDGPHLRILLLADDRHPADVVIDHFEAIRNHSIHHVTIVNPISKRLGWSIRVMNFDIIVVHYSICIVSDYQFPHRVLTAVRNFAGPKIQIVQDEYRWIDRITRRMYDIGVNAVFSSLSPETARRVYRHAYLDGITFVSGLPGYISERMKSIPRVGLTRRTVDLVYRGRPLPIWLGRCSEEKVEISHHAVRMANRFGLSVDCKVREEDRVYGNEWVDLLTKGRATLATEGGATVFDFDESIERKSVKFRQRFPETTIDEVWKEVVAPHDGKIVHRTITPRVFEAIMCRTALVLYPGRYCDILRPWEHYIPFERDGANDETVSRLVKDDVWLDAMTDRAYRRLVNDPSLHFTHYVAALDAVVYKFAIQTGSFGISIPRVAPMSVLFFLMFKVVNSFESMASTIIRVMGSLQHRLHRLKLVIFRTSNFI